MEKPVETIERGDGVRACIFHDPSCESPREWSNVGRISSREYRRAGLYGDDKYPTTYLSEPDAEGYREEVDVDPDDAESIARAIEQQAGEPIVWVEFHANDRGAYGLTGLCWCTVARAVAECGDVEKARDCMRAECDEYNSWIEGDCYGYVVQEKCAECGEWTDTDDSCWGFIGMDHCREEAQDALQRVAV